MSDIVPIEVEALPKKLLVVFRKRGLPNLLGATHESHFVVFLSDLPEDRGGSTFNPIDNFRPIGS